MADFDKEKPGSMIPTEVPDATVTPSALTKASLSPLMKYATFCWSAAAVEVLIKYWPAVNTTGESKANSTSAKLWVKLDTCLVFEASRLAGISDVPL